MANPQPDKHTRLSNEILEKLAKIRIPGEARQMLDVILRKTYGWGKKNDDIATSQFMQLTGMTKAATHRARKKLRDMNLITITKKDYSSVTEKGHSQVLNYALQKDYDKWQPLPKKVTVTKKDTNCNRKRSQTVTEKVTHKRKKETIQKKEAWINNYPYLQAEPFMVLWNAWLEVRTAKKVPNTDIAKKIALNKLHAHQMADAIKMLEQAIEKGWRGIFPLKPQDKNIEVKYL